MKEDNPFIENDLEKIINSSENLNENEEFLDDDI